MWEAETQFPFSFASMPHSGGEMRRMDSEGPFVIEATFGTFDDPFFLESLSFLGLDP